ncbi:DUF2076 domain-containing protein [Buchnera aphidicola]|uniref:DUF2076 domain-containing protein n=1 Tax=Buchnera aphidicola TaxID=9 RepID=UPI003464C724
MKDEEKKLIENLFHRLKNTELKSSERDDQADVLIQSLVKKNPHSSYYMVQTMLIQETAIKKMSLQIEELKNKISILNSEKLKKKTSFLSNFLKKDSVLPSSSYDNTNVWNNNQKPLQSANTNFPTSSTMNTTSNNGFLKNALQTATGVAGGMILGNMLMNIFHHTTPEEEIFDNIHESSVSHINEHKDIIEENENDNDHLINYVDSEYEFNSSNNNISDVDEIENFDESGINDDNFI